MSNRTILIRCRIRPGGFSGERVFVLSTGAIGCGSDCYCLLEDTRTRVPILARGEEVSGFVVGLQIGGIRDQGRMVKAALPDSEAYMVPVEDVLVERKRDPEWMPLEPESKVSI